jgi:hypothetical protein
MRSITAKELPADIKRWFEGWLKRELKPDDKITAVAFTPDESQEFHERYESMKKLRRRRVGQMEKRMRQAGLSEDETYCALNGGLKEGESFFLKPKTIKQKQDQPTLT